MATGYQKLLNKRESYVDAIKAQHEKIKKLKSESTSKISALNRLEQIQGSYSRFSTISDEILDHDSYNKESLKPTQDEIVEMYIESTTILKSLTQDENDISEVLNESNQSDYACTEFKLPPIEIPKFDGSYENWTAFHDAFMSVVDANPKFSNVQRLHYLRRYISGPAFTVIKRLPISNQNYKLALKLLEERFNNKRAIVDKCLSLFLEQESMKESTAETIRQLIDVSKDSIDCIQNMSIKIDDWDPILVSVIQMKMDNDTRREWELHLKGSKEIPSYEDLMAFLEIRFNILETSSRNREKEKEMPVAKPIQQQQQKEQYQSNAQSPKANSNSKSFVIKPDKCSVCEQNNRSNQFHWLFFCPVFESWAIEDRIKYIEESNVCKICLQGHSGSNCKSKYRCKHCKGDHNTKVHSFDSAHASTSSSNAISVNKNTVCVNLTKTNQSVLATALVNVRAKSGALHTLRVFIDKGSEGSFITENALQLLSLKKTRDRIPLTGLAGASLGKSNGYVSLEIWSLLDSTMGIRLENTMVIKDISATRQISDKSVSQWSHLKDLEERNELADPECLTATKVDLLFGVDVYASIICEGLRKGKINEPIAQRTLFGWLIFGPAVTPKNCNVKFLKMPNCDPVRVNSIICEKDDIPIERSNTSDESISKALQKFWQSEEIECNQIATEEHEMCENHFAKTHTRNRNGQYVVRIPFKFDEMSDDFLGDSTRMALSRFFKLEERLEHPKNKKLRSDYNKFMQEYIDLGHMSIAATDSPHDNYIPHHAVVREESTTTKLRVVFDASAKTDNGFSLNDRSSVGPKIQNDLFDIFIKWRSFKVALVADVEKMYRQILIAPEHRKYQKIFWRFNKSDTLKSYELNTVTYGTASAPYLAIRTLFQAATDEQQNFPEASKQIKESMYVDDYLGGATSTEKAIKLQTEISELLQSAHFPLRKWASNDETILARIPKENRALDLPLQINEDSGVKTLGTCWNPATDKLQFKIKMSDINRNEYITKRELLSNASKLFDPCGLLSPITVKSKVMLQELWKDGTQWDERIPSTVQNEWNQYKNELPIIETIFIDRWFKCAENSMISIHGFSDSSEKAMCCVLYLVQQVDNKITSSLICSKTKVAPIKAISIPRLELGASLLLSSLMKRVATNLGVDSNNIFMWTDSEIVLTWINAHPSKWKTYIANRVSTIQSNHDAKKWHHVRTHENPADIGSRGAFPSALKSNFLWWHGPDWLLKPSNTWPASKWSVPIDCDLEEKNRHTINSTKLHLIEPTRENELLIAHSNLDRLLKRTAIMLRFYFNSFKKETLKYCANYIIPEEFNRAKLLWARLTQQQYFQEYKQIQNGNEINKKSRLLPLNPHMIDDVLTVKGRLELSNLPTAQKYPIILPQEGHFTQLVIKSAHERTLHGTIHLTLARLRQEYWVINGRNAVKSFIHKCITCVKQNPRNIEQLMAPLPQYKTESARAFLHTGMDFAGPIEIKVSSKRNAAAMKGYICVFVCMATKAAHLEAVGDQTTESFIAALRRMMARRGMCSDIYCDNGSNFVGASGDIPELFQQAKDTLPPDIMKALQNDRIKFHFNPPKAANFGGQWESFVKLVKHHLKRVNTSVKLTFEEMSTLLCQIEACLNSRPLCPITCDIDDLDSLTPGHFIIGSPLNLLPEPSLLQVKEHALNRWQQIQKGLQLFWKRWNIEYLHTQHPRKKWLKEENVLNVGDLVVLVDHEQAPGKWRMARIMNLHSSKDGIIRTATVKAQSSGKSRKPTFLERPINKLCKLPVAPEDGRD